MKLQEAPAGDAAQWQLTFEGFYRLALLQGKEGAVQVKSLDMLEDNKRITFYPAFQLIPPGFVAGQKVRNTGEVTIESLET